MSVHGNREVVAAIQHLLSIAEEGRLGYLVAVGVNTENGDAIGVKVGISVLLPKIGKALGDMGKIVMEEIKEGMRPDPDPSLGADHVTFSVITDPVSFDFVTWLVDAEMTRVKEGAPAPLKVHFWFGQNGTYELAPKAMQFFENVMRPAVELLGAVEEPYCGGRHKPMYTFHDASAMARAGIHAPRFKSPNECVMDDGHDYVTITLRETVAFPERNSDLTVWTKFAGWLEQRGERVVFVRDAMRAHEPMPGGWQTYPETSFDLRERARLYQGAKMNFFTSNGAFSLALFMEKPFICFNNTPTDDDPYYPNRPDFWRLRNGMEPGTDYPWMLPNQRLIWEKPTFDGLVAAYEAFVGALPQPEAVA